MGMSKNFECNGKKWYAVFHPGGFPAVYIFPLFGETEWGLSDCGSKVYEGYDAITEEDFSWHIEHFKERVAAGENPENVLTGWMCREKGIQRIYADKYVNPDTKEKGIKAEVLIEGDYYIVDLSNVPTSYNATIPEIAYWKKGEREMTILGYMEKVSQECFKEAVEMAIFNIAKKQIPVFVQLR